MRILFLGFSMIDLVYYRGKREDSHFYFKNKLCFSQTKVNEPHFTLKRKQRRQYQVLSA